MNKPINKIDIYLNKIKLNKFDYIYKILYLLIKKNNISLFNKYLILYNKNINLE